MNLNGGKCVCRSLDKVRYEEREVSDKDARLSMAMLVKNIGFWVFYIVVSTLLGDYADPYKAIEPCLDIREPKSS